jgi:3-phenylpropionate/trans-cinnamate dioxygenase ferredoxin subunit
MAELSEPTRVRVSALPAGHEQADAVKRESLAADGTEPRIGRTWHRVGPTADFPDGSSRLVEVGGRSIGIVRVGDDFFALRNVCPHQGAPIFKGGLLKGTMLPSHPDELVYGMESLVIRCPLHGWEFDVTSGNAVFGISSKRVVTYQVKVDNDTLFVLVAGSAGA